MKKPSWTASYYDGRTAHRRGVTVTLEQRGLRLDFDDATSALWPFGQVARRQGRFQGEQLRIELTDGTETPPSVIPDDPSLADAIAALAPETGRDFRGRWNTPRVIAWSLAALAAGTAAYIWGAPVMAGWLAPRVPVAWEAAVGASVAGEFAERNPRCVDEDVAVLDSVLARLVAAAPKLPYQFRMTVVRDTIVNAFAAPGGFIMVNSGLVAASETPEEFAGVLAHEIQHVALRHSTRAVIREMPLRVAMASFSGGLETVTALAGGLGALRYRRGDEAEADRKGLALLRAARVDPSGMVTFMRRLEAKGGGAKVPGFVRYLSTHPSAESRAAMLASLAASPLRHEPLVDSATWSRARGVCR